MLQSIILTKEHIVARRQSENHVLKAGDGIVIRLGGCGLKGDLLELYKRGNGRVAYVVSVDPASGQAAIMIDSGSWKDRVVCNVPSESLRVFKGHTRPELSEPYKGE